MPISKEVLIAFKARVETTEFNKVLKNIDMINAAYGRGKLSLETYQAATKHAQAELSSTGHKIRKQNVVRYNEGRVEACIELNRQMEFLHGRIYSGCEEQS